MKKILLLLVAVAGLAGALFAGAGMLERSRIGTPLPTAAVVQGPDIDQAALMRDLHTLASPAYAGRRTGSEGSKLAQAYIAGRFAQIGLAAFGDSYAMPFSFTDEGESGPTSYRSATNLVGHIKGTLHPERVMVISAHYDHLGVRSGVVYPGADDNASGVGAMLAIASYFKANPPQNTIVFAAFDAEEIGLRGARALLKAPPFPIEQIKFNLNLDMVGRNDNNEIFAVGTRHRPSLKPMVAGVAAGSALKVKLGHDKPTLLAGGVEDWTHSSDHGPFHAAGIAFLYFGVEDHADYHGPGDTADKIKPAFYGEATRLLVRMAAKLDQNLESIR
ncbi:M28 family peptidase [Massilia sp. PAMC28688]|uniref:M20/M25/M40 family metallo-hydrolase n=1 Tax=Massilia sp. PAMC28688 TaxID=2861283 RepID=UPI001C639602|nr:M20/M25/M40 family metallo-hydrolase [Massilia sp. PAMC28688]QYF95542.1 M28 family peptidase [Massilia sp. PAMC28688]